MYSADEAAFLEDPFADGEETATGEDEADVPGAQTESAPQTATGEDTDEADAPAAQTATSPDTDEADVAGAQTESAPQTNTSEDADEADVAAAQTATSEDTDKAFAAAPQTVPGADADETFAPAPETATGANTDEADDTLDTSFAESEIRAVSQPVFGDYEAIKNQFFCTDSSPADQTDSASADTSVPGAQTPASAPQTEPVADTTEPAPQTVTNEDTDEAFVPGTQTPTSAPQTEPAPETPTSEDTAEPVSGADTASYDFDADTPQPPAFDTDDYEPNLYSGDTDDEDDDEDRFDDDEITEEDEIDIPVPQDYTQNPSAGFSQSYNAHPYSVPTEGLLNNFENNPYWIIDEETKQAAVILKETLSEFKIEAEVTGIRKGPVVTMFELLPAPGVKLNKIVALQDNIALRLAASSVRIVAPIPGKKAVGVEVPNSERAMVSFRELIEKDLPAFNKMQIPVVLGKDITGDAQMLDLATTPHLLIAGSTGSGKSVCVNSMILSILYKRSPRDVKMILIDPKIVELKLYNDIPHLLTPVITEPKKAFQALQYCLCEMERRYAMLDKMGVREIRSYNHRITERHLMQEKLPYIVVIIDEFADLMATTGKELETTVARLAAMSRAVGIHLVLATQRPSIDVITGLIKANIPSRIAFMVASKTDSRIIIDQVGSEKLLGKGDMLYASAIDPFPVRIQGTFVTEDEVERVVNYVKQIAPPEYIDDEIFVEEDEDEDTSDGLFTEGEDPLYDKALNIVVQEGKASASYLQRRLKIGYNRAARLVEDMEARGIVGPANGSKPRELIHVP
ncbi:MAG: DNA translocase FtsK [Treponemataceae bacterium]|nr:DNA translocase FtsK [Treponemataceae bacterium]